MKQRVDYYEKICEQEEQSFKYRKEFENTICPRCNMFLTPVKMPNGIKWCCGSIDCYYSNFEKNED